MLVLQFFSLATWLCNRNRRRLFREDLANMEIDSQQSCYRAQYVLALAMTPLENELFYRYTI